MEYSAVYWLLEDVKKYFPDAEINPTNHISFKLKDGSSVKAYKYKTYNISFSDKNKTLKFKTIKRMMKEIKELSHKNNIPQNRCRMEYEKNRRKWLDDFIKNSTRY